MINSSYKTIKLGKKLGFIIKFDVCIDVNKHQTNKNFNSIMKNIIIYGFGTIKHIKNFAK